jgi:hypothetical protein
LAGGFRREDNDVITVKIEDKEYIVTDEVLKGTLEFLLKIGFFIYDEKIPALAQLGLQQIARKELYEREKKDKEHRDIYRPEKKEDPVKHLATLAKDEMTKELDSAIGEHAIGLRVNANNEIISIEFKNPSASGGPLALSRDIR